jgi:hypothetical protein
MSPFIPDASVFIDVLRQRKVSVLNCLPSDIRKRTIQSLCHDFGLPTVTVPRTGPDDELLIVKTDLNSGGRREQLLSPAQKTQFNLEVDGRGAHEKSG